ncbi:MAG: PAS domain S-box protein [Candidatus Falkowbacteria bacterium]
MFKNRIIPVDLENPDYYPKKKTGKRREKRKTRGRREGDFVVAERLRLSEEQYNNLLEYTKYAPVSMWVEDYSGVKSFISCLKKRGVVNFERHFNDHPKDVLRALDMVTVKYVNVATVKLYKAKKADDLLGPLSRIIKSESLPLFREQLIAIAKRKKEFETETVTTTLTGEKIDIQLKINFPNTEAKFSNLLVCVNDITAHKKAENQLKENRTLLKSVIESLPFALFALNKENKYILQNSQCRKSWGNIIGKTLKEVSRVNAKEKAIWGENNRAAMKGKTINRETERSSGEGKRYFQSTVAPIREDSEISGVLGMDIDITGRKLVEKKLKDSTEDLKKFKLAVKYASDMVVITDNKGAILYANKAAEKISGYSQSEIIGEKIGGRKLWGGTKDSDYYNAMWTRIRDEKKTFIGELKNKRKDGTEYEAEIRISPVFDDNKDILFYIAIERDITEQKEIDRAKSEFVSLASHQLRTPLSSISLSAELLLKDAAGQVTKEQAEYLNDIYEDVFKMSELINALLNISKIEMGTFVAEPEPAEIVDLIDCALAEVETQIKNKKIDVAKNIDRMVPTIEVDKNIIRVVMHNLLHNSIKYSGAGGRIEINAKRAGGSIILSVKDNGVGIPSRQQSKIFSKYFRADNVKKIEASGTGLGLYISRSLLEEVGGKIWFESRINQGTVFSFSLPLKAKKR